MGAGGKPGAGLRAPRPPFAELALRAGQNRGCIWAVVALQCNMSSPSGACSVCTCMHFGLLQLFVITCDDAMWGRHTTIMQLPHSGLSGVIRVAMVLATMTVCCGDGAGGGDISMWGRCE